MSKKAKTSKNWVLYFKLIVVIFLINAIYQIFLNPIHLFSFISKPFSKTPQQTWDAYSEIFQRQGDTRITPELLAAIAQVESAGNPLAAPPWQFSLSTDVAQLFAPASSAFGIMQITKGTFETMRKLAKEEGRPTPVMTRLRVEDSVQLSAIHLRRSIQDLIGDRGWDKLDRRRSTHLASVIHLCGPEVGKRLIKLQYRTERLPRCGSHWPEVYSNRVWELRQYFEKNALSSLASR
jgi:hypothetical protein